MSDSSLIYLQFLTVEQRGWLHLHGKAQELTFPALISHIGTDEVVLFVSSIGTTLPPEILSGEFRYVTPAGIYTFVSNTIDVERKQQGTGTYKLTFRPSFTMTFQQQRDFLRVELDEATPLSFIPLYPNDYAPGQGLIIDISGGGVRFIADEFIHSGAILRMEFSLPDEDKPVKTIGQIVRKEFNGGKSTASVRFLDIAESDQRRLINFTVTEQLRLATTQYQQRRKFSRINLSKPLSVKLRGIDQEEVSFAEATNLGGGGLLLHTERKLESHPLFQLTFRLPSDHTEINAYGKMVEEEQTEGGFANHIEFVEINRDHQQAIVQYVLEQQMAWLADKPVIVETAEDE